MKTRAEHAGDFFETLQNSICAGIEELDGSGRFREDVWTHATGGGGRTRMLEGGSLVERGGVNTSFVHGTLTPALAARLNTRSQKFSACGISLVLHPQHPKVPAVHANFRYLELEDRDFWFGGGADLTPSYLFDEDAVHFHRTWKAVCDRHDPSYYPKFKQACDSYFFLPHRGETRGIGGIFFDYLRGEFDSLFPFIRTCGDSFLEAYLPIARRRNPEPWGPAEREWQLLRRGRYVEFNLLHDRGTMFGLETGGRTESILMSLPPLVRWAYDHHPRPGSPEDRLLGVLKEPRNWV
jgi:coproporphyrinogen III oxidase